MAQERGELIRGAKPLAELVFGDEGQWRLIYNAKTRRELGIFVLAGRLCGFRGVIDRRLNSLSAIPDKAA